MFVISTDVDVMHAVTASTAGPRGVLDFWQDAAVPEAGSALARYEFAAEKAGCSTVLFDAAALDKARIDYLRDRFLTVWTAVDGEGSDEAATDDVNTRVAIHTAILSGTQAIVSSEYKRVYTALEAYRTSGSLARVPGIVGHRGSKNRSGYPGNTLAAYQRAVKQGDRMIETDVWDTAIEDPSDLDALVVSHDKPTSVEGDTHAFPAARNLPVHR